MSTLKVDTIKSDTTPTLTISDGLSVTGVTTTSNDLILTNSNHVTQVLKAGGSSSDLAIQFKDSSGNIESSVFCASDAGDLRLKTGGNTERLRVRGDGRVSIASSLAVAGVSTAAAFVPSEGQLSNRNIIINGAMQVAQRGTSSTTEGYSTIDRFSNEEGSCDEAPTQSQHGLNSADTGPWAEGFRNSFHIQNGNQTSGAQAANFIKLTYQVEARDMANSGWNYTSTSSYITLSFWVKSSVAQNFYGRLTTHDGTAQNYPFETGSLSVNTWTKITKKIPGNSNITINNDNGAGLGIEWMTYRGGNTTDSGVALDTWAAYASGTRTPDQTSTWFTTNDATFEVTGVQLEVGSYATPFEHRIFADELARCQRYFYMIADGSVKTSAAIADGRFLSSGEVDFMVSFPVTMRAQPTLYQVSGADYFKIMYHTYNQYVDGNWTIQYAQPNGCSHYATPDATGSADKPAQIVLQNSAARLGYTADL